MEMELRKETVHVQEAVYSKCMQVLSESDFIVPDAKSDIAKILQLDSTATVDHIVANEDGMQISGHVDVTALYVPDGQDVPACSVPLRLEFTAEPELSGVLQGCKCIAEAEVCHVEYTLLNSRKLSVRTVVDVDIKCYRERAVETVCEVDGGIEAKRESLQIYNLLHTSMYKFSLRETLAFPAGKPSAVSVLKTDVKLTDKEVRMVTDKVVVKGNVQICTLYVSDKNSIEFMEHELPFTEVLDAEGAAEDCMCDLDIALSDMQASLGADTDGDMRFLDFGVLCSASITVSAVTNLSLITDCFCRDKELICTSEPFLMHTLAGTGGVQASVKGVMQLSAGAPEIESVYNVVATPYVRQVHVSENTATAEGTVTCYLLYLSASGTSPVSTAKAQIDFNIPIGIEGLHEGMDCELSIEPVHTSYNLTMSGEIEIRCVLRLDAKAIEEKTVHLITGARMEDTPLPLRHGILLYFVKPGDTLWEIAKCYRVPLALLKSVNKLENPDLIYPGQRLLIPNVPNLPEA